MSNYARGRAYEHEVAKLFEKDGYEVTRAAGSKGEWDLIARKKTQRRKKECWIAVYVQCKSKGR